MNTLIAISGTAAIVLAFSILIYEAAGQEPPQCSRTVVEVSPSNLVKDCEFGSCEFVHIDEYQRRVKRHLLDHQFEGVKQ